MTQRFICDQLIIRHGIVWSCRSNASVKVDRQKFCTYCIDRAVADDPQFLDFNAVEPLEDS